ncbi:single-stranded DNA-binding protein [Streptomyces sp. NPDC002018]|uniref:single-stranded DNA-binding protein n=1 Tax=Streptomyces sp. NPDC002018 TaxID=3364629 RepID=UPI0036AA4731
MNDTVVTVVGNVATGVEFRESAAGGVARFRFAVTARRWDRQRNGWADGPTSFYTVWAWRTLGANLAASVSVGEPLVVHGRLRVREDERDGQRRVSADIDAVAVGHDLTRGTSAFRRAGRASPPLTERHGKAARSQDEGRGQERDQGVEQGRRVPDPVAGPVAAPDPFALPGPAPGPGRPVPAPGPEPPAAAPDPGRDVLPGAIPVA